MCPFLLIFETVSGLELLRPVEVLDVEPNRVGSDDCLGLGRDHLDLHHALHGDTALLVDGTSPTSIADGILQYLDNPSLRDTKGRQARQRAVDRFQYAVRRDKMIAVIDRLVKV